MFETQKSRNKTSSGDSKSEIIKGEENMVSILEQMQVPNVTGFVLDFDYTAVVVSKVGRLSARKPV